MNIQSQICEPIRSAIVLFQSMGFSLESTVIKDSQFNEYEIDLRGDNSLAELEIQIVGIEQYDNQTYNCMCHWSSIYLNREDEEPTIIKMVLPIDYYELIIETDRNKKYLFNPNELGLYEDHKFLAYPDKLRKFDLSDNSIKWENGSELRLKRILEVCKQLSKGEAKNKMITISSYNNAPTERHPSHHVYSVHLKPYNSEQLICLSESIGGGHGEMGGGHYYTLENLKTASNWKEHLIKSNCGWGIEIIESMNSEKEIVDGLVNKFLEIKKTIDNSKK